MLGHGHRIVCWDMDVVFAKCLVDTCVRGFWHIGDMRHLQIYYVSCDRSVLCPRALIEARWHHPFLSLVRSTRSFPETPVPCLVVLASFLSFVIRQPSPAEPSSPSEAGSGQISPSLEMLCGI